MDTTAKIEKWIFYFLGGYALLSNVTIAGSNVFLGLAVAAAVVRLAKKHDDWRERLKVDKDLGKPFFLFVGVMVITSLFSLDILTSYDELFNHYVNRIVPFLLVLMFVRDKTRLIKLGMLVGGSIIINAIMCILQTYGVVDDEGSRGRAPGLIGIMMTAGMMSMWIPVLTLLVMECKKRYRLWLIIALFISVLGMIYNGTRGAWLAVVITVCVTSIIYAKNKLKVLVVFLLFGIALGCIVNNVPWMQQRVASMTQTYENRSNRERLYLWQSARNMTADYPLTGVGYGCFREQYQTKYILPEAEERRLTHAHSNFFHVMAESGYPGAVAVCIWWLGTIVYCAKGWKKYNNIGYLTFMAIFLGIMLQGATEYTMGDSIVMKLFWFGLGLSYQWTKIKDDEIQSGAV
ncbi:O-antigen ligase family protein [Anaerovibrio lipolyticus]|uniref:O-antigen ligase family protein n=1 Tax=Anaerovibrio lipolyticus TaxID=82374 RepID=UPI00047F6DFA|nr:O-antigen ligase family protein [Anaerovibrio lipolyticus]